MQISRHIKRLTLVSTSVAALLGGIVIASSSADLQSQINANKSSAAALQSQINSEAAQIEKTRGGVAAAEEKLSSVQAALDAHIAQLRSVQTNLMTARDQLLALEDKLHVAAKYLAANLRSEYENGSPNLVDVILNAHGFSSLLDSGQLHQGRAESGRRDRSPDQDRPGAGAAGGPAPLLAGDQGSQPDQRHPRAAQPGVRDPGCAGQAAARRGVGAVAQQEPAGERQRPDGQASEAIRRAGRSRAGRRSRSGSRSRGRSAAGRPGHAAGL